MGLESRKEGGLEKPPSNVEIVETPAGKFRIVYGIHTREQLASDLGSNYAAVVLEAGADEIGDMEKGGMRNDIQYKAILAELEKVQKPIFIVDTESMPEVWAGLGVELGQAVLGGALLYKGLFKGSERAMTRRDFLKKSSFITAGVYFSGDGLLSMLGSGARTGDFDETVRGLTKARETIYPQSHAYILTLRNLITAEKMEDMHRRNKDFSGHEIVAVYGRLHTGLSDAIKMDRQDRLKKIETILNLYPLPFVSAEEVASVVRFDFDPEKKQWLMRQDFNQDLLSLARTAKQKPE